MRADYMRFNRVDFGKGQARKVQARVACGQRMGSFEIRLDNPKGQKLAEFPMEYTGGWNAWSTIEAEIEGSVSGVHDLVVVFNTDWGSTKSVNLNWLLITE